MHYGCIAEHLKHSFSPEIHACLGDYRYELREIEPDALGRFMTERDFRGINVTIPYKEKVIPYLYEIDDRAKAIGAVNTIVNRGGKLYGYNTDFYGMSALINRVGVSLSGKKVAVLGTGGTSRTACAVANSLGAAVVLRVSRSTKDSAIDYGMLRAQHSDVQILINTTPCGMFPNPDGTAVNVDDFAQLEGVVDAVYNPLRPQLVLDAKRKGIPAEGGLFMLVAQAVRASEIFFDTVYPDDTAERVYNKLLPSKENLVLIGMPASGKSTVGKLLAQRLGLLFFDMDELIVQRAQKTIPAIFEEVGECGFRDLESLVLREEFAQRNGIVISTGGGAILRDENVNMLRRNGRLYFLDRPLDDLLPTDDRPLSSTKEAIAARYRERYPRYMAVADVQIPVVGTPEQVVETIGKDFKNRT